MTPLRCRNIRKQQRVISESKVVTHTHPSSSKREHANVCLGEGSIVIFQGPLSLYIYIYVNSGHFPPLSHVSWRISWFSGWKRACAGISSNLPLLPAGSSTWPGLPSSRSSPHLSWASWTPWSSATSQMPRIWRRWRWRSLPTTR